MYNHLVFFLFLQDSNESLGVLDKDKSISLNSNDLPLIQEHVPTPQSSIHLDIQDFHYSSEYNF